MTSTMPRTSPDSATTGKCRYLWSCIWCIASTKFIAGGKKSGFGVITSRVSILSGSNSFATTLLRTSLGVMIPARFPFSTTRTALRAEDIASAVSRTEESGSANSCVCFFSITSPNVGMESPNIDSMAANIFFMASALFFLLRLMALAICFKSRSEGARCAVLPSSCLCSFSIFEMVSYRHFAISRTPTIEPSWSVTGRWRNRCFTMIESASKALSSM
mmetsp:Transcript_4818/g.6612  ORF Transcript_4818/g.6612 Transcript_4818/m.6612 type:complete len:218 (-) Transcript_4818:1534-2187(-)